MGQLIATPKQIEDLQQLPFISASLAKKLGTYLEFSLHAVQRNLNLGSTERERLLAVKGWLATYADGANSQVVRALNVDASKIDREKVREMVTIRKMEQEARKYMNDLRKQAFIEIK